VNSRDAYRPPLQQRPYLAGVRSVGSFALEYGAFVAVEAAADLRRFRSRRLNDLRAGQEDVLSLLGFPDFLQDGRARATRRSGIRLPDVQRVLGARATIDPGDGGRLSFGQLPLLALSLVLLSSVLLVGALLPPGALAHMPVSPARFAHIRQRLALAAIAILLAVAFVWLATALS
jgi:hypothetical protein